MVHCFFGQQKLIVQLYFCCLNAAIRHYIFKYNPSTLIVDLQPRKVDGNLFCLLSRITACFLLYLLSHCKILWHSSGVLFWTSCLLNNVGILVSTLKITDLKVQSWKLFSEKYMIALTQITNTEIFAFIDILVFKLWSRKVLFRNKKDNRNC